MALFHLVRAAAYTPEMATMIQARAASSQIDEDARAILRFGNVKIPRSQFSRVGAASNATAPSGIAQPAPRSSDINEDPYVNDGAREKKKNTVDEAPSPSLPFPDPGAVQKDPSAQDASEVTSATLLGTNLSPPRTSAPRRPLPCTQYRTSSHRRVGNFWLRMLTLLVLFELQVTPHCWITRCASSLSSVSLPRRDRLSKTL
jgi:hypothetical protein